MSIKEQRLKRKMTQKELAEKIGTSRSNISKWESGDTAPRAKLLPILAQILRCKIDKLLEK